MPTRHAFQRVAVLNRGEAAVRFTRAARTWARMRGATLDVVAFFTHPDRAAPFVRMASAAVCLGDALVDVPGGGRRSAYLDVGRSVELALSAGADAIWPGWGFLAESDALADACADAGIVFIGPSGDAMRLLGDKIAAKHLAEGQKVPVSDWSRGLVPTPAEARKHAERIGYPVLLKATAGGGGRGIRVVTEPSALDDAFRSASAEAASAFGNAGLLVEAFVPAARHVEVQVLADRHGTVWALGTRDCSMQRRHQKLIEEAPAPGLSRDVEAALCESAARVARASSYVGAGTAEFLLLPDGERFIFLEMNTRLQVEHPVTECVYGVDLVVGQIDVAQGMKLAAKPPKPRGAAVEVRLNAEDPDDGFAPSAGRIVRFEAPQGPGIRVDSGFALGDVVPTEFDSNLAKIIAWGDTRAEAFARLETGLRDTIVAIDGGPTNRSLLLELCRHPVVARGAVTTRWLDGHLKERPGPRDRAHLDIALCAAAIGDHLRARRGHLLNFLQLAQKGLPRRVPEAAPSSLRYVVGGTPVTALVATLGPSNYRVVSGDGALTLRAESTGPRTMLLESGGKRFSVVRIGTATAVYVEVDGVAHRLLRTSDGRVLAAIPAAVTRVHVRPGERVAPGDRLVTLEVMKMESTVESPLGGLVTAVHVDAASRVAAGDLLVTIEGESGPATSGAPELTPFSTAADDDPVRLLQLAVLGYDVDDRALGRAVKAIDSGAATLAQRDLFDVLRAAVALDSLVQSGTYDDARSSRGESSVDQLGWFIRHLRPDPAELSERFLARLRELLDLHGVVDLRRGFALESALVRIFQAHHGRKRVDRALTSALAALVRASDDASGPADEARRREVLERLANFAVQRNRLLAQAVYQAIHLLCDRPRQLLSARRYGAEGVSALTRLVDPGASDDERAQARRALHDLPLGSLLGLLPLSVDEPLHRRQCLLSVVMERIYEATAAPPEAGPLCAVRITPRDGDVAVGLFVTTAAQLQEVVRALPARVHAVDVLLGFTPHAEALFEVLAGLASPARVSIVWGSSEDGIRSRTFTLTGGAPVEATIYRDLHPARAMALEIDRLSAFDVQRLPAPGGLFLALARAKDGSGDERLFVVAEVERFDTETDPTDPDNVRLPTFERTYLDAIHAIREATRLRHGRDKLVWNRLTLFMRQPVRLTRRQVERLAERLAPPTAGLGLEKVVVRARLAMPGEASGEPEDLIIEWSNPTGRGPVLSFALPRHRPIRVLSDYERRVVDARRRGQLYPYELIRTIASDGVAGFAEGEFEELDLDESGTALVSVYKRPYGQNQANLVVGRITNRVARFPRGLTRVLIVGDPTRTMGSLAEPECRRIIAAIDLAEKQRIPVEWVPVSSGAKISFDSGTENLDWTARVLRRIVEFTQSGGTMHVIVDGVCVGAQSYWNAEATMLPHCRGALVMTPQGSMLLTGQRALEYSGSVSAPTNQGIGGLDEIMGPNGESQYAAPNLREAYRILFRHYDLTYVVPGEATTRRVATTDPVDRDVTRTLYRGAEGFATIGELFSDATNPGRKRPFAIREVLRAVLDQDVEPLERWRGLHGGETAVVVHGQLGGQPVVAIGIESMPMRRKGDVPADGPDTWSSGTLFPESSRKVARAINAASGVAPVVVLANLSGFDGSPESLRRRQLEFGAQIGRSVVNFQGPLIFCVIARYHGGAYVVFSQALNDRLESLALEGSFASVIGGGPAAAVVFPGLVKSRVLADPRVVAERARMAEADSDPRAVPAAELRYEGVYREVEAEVQGVVAREFDAVHSVERARQVGSLSAVIPASRLRPILCERLGARSRAAKEPTLP